MRTAHEYIIIQCTISLAKLLGALDRWSGQLGGNRTSANYRGFPWYKPANANHVTLAPSPEMKAAAATDPRDFPHFCEQYSLLPPQKQYDVVWRLLENTEVQYPLRYNFCLPSSRPPRHTCRLPNCEGYTRPCNSF